MRNKYHIFIVLFLAIGMTSLAYASDEHDHNLETNFAKMQANTYCPVMGDMKIDTQVFTDYKGKRVYFCCLKCRTTFQADPTKYLHRLEQFGSANRPDGHEHKNRGRHFSPARLIKPLGITTLSLLIFTGITGIFRRKLPRPLIKWHKPFGIITLVFALLHATLVVIFH